MGGEKESSDVITARVLPWQRDLVQELVDLKQRARLPHALLIEAESTVDSAAFGWYLITALLCDNPDGEGQPCGRCSHCELMRANSHPDFTFCTLLEDEKTHKLKRDIVIEQIRRLIHRLGLTNSKDNGCFALIYPAERMNAAAANSLLKTLEEPTASTTLVLLSHHPARLPITIRSRCQRRRLNNPPQDSAQSWLRQQSLSEEQAQSCLDLAHGDTQLALKLYREGFVAAQARLVDVVEQYYAGERDVVAAVNEIKDIEVAVLRHLIRAHLLGKIRAAIGAGMTPDIKWKLGAMIELMAHAEHVLRADEHNLNILLQLEDVLISSKQILIRG